MDNLDHFGVRQYDIVRGQYLYFSLSAFRMSPMS